MWLCDSSNINFDLEDDMLRKEKASRQLSSTFYHLEDDRFTARARFLMLCVFGASGSFAKHYEACEVHERDWRGWIRRSIDKYLKDCERDFTEMEEGIFEVDESDMDIMDEEDRNE